MVRISELLNPGGEPPKKPVPPAVTPQPAPKDAGLAGPASPPASQVRIGPAVASVSTGLAALYEQLLVFVRVLFDRARASEPLQLAEAIALIGKLPNTKLDGGISSLLELISCHTEGQYLYSHSVNVTLLVNHLAYCLGYAKPSCQQLALAGLLHDLGMAGQAEELANQAGPLTDEQKQIVASHPAAAVQQLKDAQMLSHETLDAIRSHHERNKGQGYPEGLNESWINEYAKVLAVCDVYDALTHPRSYRKPINPALAVKMLIDGVGDQFDRRVVKALVDELSLYPRGSVVKLNTGEVGIVDSPNPKSPLRPTVLVVRDATGAPVNMRRLIDLVEQPFIYVKEIVADLDSGGSGA